MPEEDKQIFTTHSFKEDLRKKFRSLASEVKDTLGIKVETKVAETPRKPKQLIVTETRSKEKDIEPAIFEPTVLFSTSSARSKEVKHEEKKGTKKIKVKKEEREFKISKEEREKLVLIFLGLLIIGVFIFGIVASFKYLRFKSTPPQINLPKEEKVFCGGIANIQCPAGYFCQLEGKYPDAGGHCVKGSVLNNL